MLIFGKRRNDLLTNTRSKMNLKQHLTAASKLVDKNPVLHALTCALIRNGLCTVGNLFAMYTFPIKIEGEGMVSWQELKGVLGSGGFTHGVIENERCVLQLDGTQVALKAEHADDYPEMLQDPDIEVLQRFSIPARYLIDALLYPTTDELRIQMTGVAVSKKHVMASDGHVLYFRNLFLDGIEINMPKRVFKVLLPNSRANFEILSDNKHVRMHFEEAVVVFRKIDEPFPDLLGVVPPMAYSVLLNRRMVDVAIARLAPVVNGSTKQFTLEVKEFEAAMYAEDLDTDSKGRVNLGDHEHDDHTFRPFRANFNLEFFSKVLQSDKEICKIEWTGDKTKLFKVNDNGLMPVLDSVDA